MVDGRIRDEDIDEVRERADLVEVISSQVQLKKAGRVFKGLCPFHHEKTPSFMVDPDKQLYHCFGCGRGGNIYNFLMEMENLDFPEAVKTLARRISYNLHFEKVSVEKKALLGKQTRLYNLNYLAREFYQNLLLSSNVGKKAYQYLRGRGYTDETIKTFLLGYAPEGWEVFTSYALKKGYKKEELLEAGLVVASEKKEGEVYDRFRGRVIFPILDLQGRTVGFGGRVLKEEQPKYLNSPETPIYHKGKALYALNWAKPHIASSEQAIIVEGYTDVISLHQSGFKDAVATLGTALTADHLRLLSRFAEKVILIFDADVAGRLAAERGLAFVPDFYLSSEYSSILDLVERRHLDIEVAILPKGSDPADFISTQGADKFKDLISKSRPMVDFSISAALIAHNLSTIEGRKKAASTIIDIVAPLPSAVAQEEYLKKAADELKISYDSLFLEFQRKRPTARTKLAAEQTTRPDPVQRMEEEALKVILQFPETSPSLLTELEVSHFTLAQHQHLFVLLKEHFKKEGTVSSRELLDKILDEEIRRLATRLAVSSIVSEDKAKYGQEIFARIKEFELRRRISKLKGEIQKINPEKEPQRYDALFEELLTLEALRRELSSK